MTAIAQEKNVRISHATRPYFMPSESLGALFSETDVTFRFYGGFSLYNKRRTISEMHDAILKSRPGARILEVSRKSEHAIGERLSAFNLIFETADGRRYPVENVFQSSKVFDKGGPYRDLLSVMPKDAKTDPRIKDASARLLCFSFEGRKWPLEPRSCFYDYIYIAALAQNGELADELQGYDAFTDIEFNPKKQFNCQARSVAIFISLCRNGLLNEYLHDPLSFAGKIYPDNANASSLLGQKSEWRQQELF